MSKCWYCNNLLTSGDSSKHFGICNKCYDEMFKSGDTIIRSLTNKIAELQKQLHDLPKKIVEEIKDKIPEIGGMKCEIIIDDSLTLNTLLDTILKKYGGEDE